MSFKTRNLYYLRISEISVLPVYVYLDERHLDWMSDQVLQHVLSDLRPRILPKLMTEAGLFTSSATDKKAAVDTHRGESYQFCYFLRRTEPHSVAIKTRNYVARTQIPIQSTNNISTVTPYTSTTNPARAQRKRKTRSTSIPVGSPPPRSAKKPRKDGTMELVHSEGDVPAPTKERRVWRTDVIDVDQDKEMIDVDAEDDVDEDDETWVPEQDTFYLPVEEEKPKPALQLTYKGFGIYGQCLCIVVEPWPAIRSTTRVPQELGGITSKKSKKQATSSSVTTTTTRAKTPLFLTDDNDADQDDAQNQRPDHVTNPWGNDLETMDDSDNDSEMGGMMAFSQALNLAGDNRPGAVEDDDEMEGAVLFGDADEARQL